MNILSLWDQLEQQRTNENQGNRRIEFCDGFETFKVARLIRNKVEAQTRICKLNYVCKLLDWISGCFNSPNKEPQTTTCFSEDKLGHLKQVLKL
jgi:hypothetical protein